MEKSGTQDAIVNSESADALALTNWLTNVVISTSSSAATRAKKTATPEDQQKQLARLSAVSSSALLTNFALALWSGRTRQPSEKTPPGPGGDSDLNLSDLVTQCCPSDSGRVALGRTSGATACSCSPNFRAPNARDWKGMSAKSWRERTKGDKTPTLPDQIGGVPHPEFVEELYGFPIGWTDCEGLATPCAPPQVSGSGEE